MLLGVRHSSASRDRFGSPTPPPGPHRIRLRIQRIRRYVVGVLTLVYSFSFTIEILSMLVRPIRRDLGISTTEMSL